MAGSFTSIHQCDISLHIPGIDAIYRTRPARARWEKSDRSVTCPADSLLGRVAPVGTCRGSHWEVRRRATARRSPCNSFSLGWKDEFSVTRGRRLISGLYFLSQLCLTSSTYQSPFFLVFLTRS